MLLNIFSLSSSSVISKNVSSKFSLLNGPVVKFFKCAFQSDNNLLGLSFRLLNLTLSSVSEQTSVVHIFSESVLEFEGINRRKFCFEYLVARLLSKVTTSTLLSIGENDSFLKTVLSILVVDGLQLDCTIKFVSFMNNAE